jgi:hypothetical protein
MTLTDKDIMPFGKHQGKLMGNVPSNYLMWLWDNVENRKGDVFDYIKDNWDVIVAQIKRDKLLKNNG